MAEPTIVDIFSELYEHEPRGFIQGWYEGEPLPGVRCQCGEWDPFQQTFAGHIVGRFMGANGLDRTDPGASAPRKDGTPLSTAAASTTSEAAP